MATNIDQISDSTFTITFNSTTTIHTTLTSSGDEASSWISQTLLLPHPIIGIDIEWRPSFSRHHQNPVSLLQLCAGDRCLLFQILRADHIPPSLHQFLADRTLTFVGVGISEDAERLLEERELVVANAVDLRELAAERMGREEMRGKGLVALAGEVMGVVVRKPERVRMSRWDQVYLTLEQIKYACVDAFLSFEIGRRLFDGTFLTDLG